MLLQQVLAPCTTSPLEPCPEGPPGRPGWEGLPELGGVVRLESPVAPGGAVLPKGSPSPHSAARPLLASLQRSGGSIQSSRVFMPHKNSLQRCVLKDPIQTSF